jgi:hypothetical protein
VTLWCRGHPAPGRAARRAGVVSSDDEGTQKLLAAAPDLIVPELRPYRTRADTSGWVRDDAIVRYLEQRLARHRYVGVGEFHLYGADAELPVPRRMVALARERGLLLHAHSDVDAVERLFRQWPEARVLWAHSGFDRPEAVREMLRRHPRCGATWPSAATMPAAARSTRPGARPSRNSRALHDRHRHLHARALALHRAACRMDPRLAGRPAAPLAERLGLAQWRRAAAHGGAPRHDPGVDPALLGCWRCPGRGRWPPTPTAVTAWTRRQRRVIELAAAPDRVRARSQRRWRSGRHFALDVVVCARAGAALPVALRVDADMPAHRHGMNYRPTVRALGDGRYRADGLMLHMAGRWRCCSISPPTAGWCG